MIAQIDEQHAAMIAHAMHQPDRRTVSPMCESRRRRVWEDSDAIGP